MKKLALMIPLILGVSYAFVPKKINTYYIKRNGPTFNIEKISQSKTIFDVCPDLWKYMIFNQKQRNRLDSLRKIHASLAFYTFHDAGYNNVMDVYSLELETYQANKKVRIFAEGQVLSEEQINSIKNLTLGNTIAFNVKLKSKYKVNAIEGDYYFEGYIPIVILPNTEASFAAGTKEFNNYIENNIVNKYTPPKDIVNLHQIKVKFTVEKDGTLSGTKIIYPSNNHKIDQFVIEQINKMPKWNAARNRKGAAVKQDIEIVFGSSFDGC